MSENSSLAECPKCRGIFHLYLDGYHYRTQCPFVCIEEEPEDEPDDEEEEEGEPDGWSLEDWRKWGLMKQSEKDACQHMSKEEWQQRNWKQCPVCQEVLIDIESGMCEECYQQFTC